MNESNDLLKLIDAHRFHNPLIPKVCHLCKVEQYRQGNTPTTRWNKAVIAAFKPSTPAGILMLYGVIATAAVAALLGN